MGLLLPGFFAAACILGFCTCLGIGANDLANSFGTAYGSKALTMKQLVVIAFFAEVGGAILMGATVSETVKKGVVNVDLFADNVSRFMWGMVIALMSTGGWLALATWKSLPVSTTHSIVGSVIGFGLVEYGFADGVIWAESQDEFPFIKGVLPVFLSWFVSPLLAGIMSVMTYSILRVSILRQDPRENPLLAAFIFAGIVLVAMFVNAYFILVKGMKARVKWSRAQSAWISALIALPLAMAAFAAVIWLVKRMESEPKEEEEEAEKSGSREAMIKGQPTLSFLQKSEEKSEYVMEKYNHNVENGLFRYLQIFTCTCVAFSHGSNDVANGVGAVGAVYSAVTGGEIHLNHEIPFYFLAVGGFAMGLGSIFGRNVLEVVGNDIVKLTPSRGFSAEFSTAGTVMIASVSGAPVSTTMIVTGSVIGVGLVDNWRHAVQWSVCGRIFFGWVLTIVVTVSTSAILYLPVHFWVSKPRGTEMKPLAVLVPFLLPVLLFMVSQCGPDGDGKEEKEVPLSSISTIRSMSSMSQFTGPDGKKKEIPVSGPCDLSPTASLVARALRMDDATSK